MEEAQTRAIRGRLHPLLHENLQTDTSTPCEHALGSETRLSGYMLCRQGACVCPPVQGPSLAKRTPRLMKD